MIYSPELDVRLLDPFVSYYTLCARQGYKALEVGSPEGHVRPEERKLKVSGARAAYPYACTNSNAKQPSGEIHLFLDVDQIDQIHTDDDASARTGPKGHHEASVDANPVGRYSHRNLLA